MRFAMLNPPYHIHSQIRLNCPVLLLQGGAAAEMLSDAEDDEHKSDAPFRADSSPDLPGNLYTQTTPTDGSIGGATANASQAPDSLAAVAEAFKGNKIMHSSDASKTSSSFSVDDTPLKSHRASGGDRVSRRARPVRDSLTSQDETTQDPGNVSSSRESSQPVSRQSRSASVRASQETMQDALKATQHAASSGGGVLFIGGDKPVKPTPVAVDDAGSKPVAGNNLQNIFSRGVSRLRKPGSFGRAGTRAPEVIAPSPSAADKQDDGAAAKKTFGWGRPAAQPSHLPSGPGKRRKKYGADENEAAAAAAAASTNMFQHSAHHSMAKMAGHTLKKITTPLNGFKKSASKFLASHSAKKPSIQLRGNDLSTAFDAYASESPTDAGL